MLNRTASYPDNFCVRAYDRAQGTSNAAAVHEAEVRHVRALLPQFAALMVRLNSTESPDAAWTEAVHGAAARIDDALGDLGRVCP